MFLFPNENSQTTPTARGHVMRDSQSEQDFDDSDDLGDFCFVDIPNIVSLLCNLNDILCNFVIKGIMPQAVKMVFYLYDYAWNSKDIESNTLLLFANMILSTQMLTRYLLWCRVMLVLLLQLTSLVFITVNIMLSTVFILFAAISLFLAKGGSSRYWQ